VDKRVVPCKPTLKARFKPVQFVPKMKWDDLRSQIAKHIYAGETQKVLALLENCGEPISEVLNRREREYRSETLLHTALLFGYHRPNPHEYRPRDRLYLNGEGEFIPAWNEIRKMMRSYLALWVRLYVAGPLSSHPRRSEAIRSWGPHVASFLTGDTDTMPRSWRS
jgi:hypothetical protein